VALADAALAKGAVGEYQLQAAIAAVHDEAERAGDTDWPQILALYGMLRRLSDNPLVALNQAIATAMIEGPRAGLALLEPLQHDERLRGSHRLAAVRAHLLERAGERSAAVKLYREAATKTTSLPERNYLLSKAAQAGEA
jgi:predicted RNA polymerase sigma factor